MFHFKLLHRDIFFCNIFGSYSKYLWPDLGKPALSSAFVIRAIARFRRLSKFLSILFFVQNKKYDAYALRSYNYNTGGAL